MKLIVAIFLPILSAAQLGWEYKTSTKDPMSWSASTVFNYIDKAKNKEVQNYLVLGCKGDKPFIEIQSGKFLGSTGNKLPIMITLDSETPFSENWRIKSPYVLSKKASGRRTASFIMDIARHQFLKVRVEPFGSLPMTSVFNLNGILEQVSKIKIDCPNKIKYWE